jgi:hypothetical protein
MSRSLCVWTWLGHGHTAHMHTYQSLQRTVHTTLIEMLGEFFLIYDEGRRCKVTYDENIFPHI